ncbi:adenylyltransferase/cytidyltransferase family protein [Polaribacter ponticola]|uniref:Adenylyltransferase/cytidyltransferase family protein n=1 Tax=Polaribacter ponticola TaxID=2978475 RepID=A0ABT5S5L4_9FLAO|nr:adenylyltransferase/cytidyltransferase family protein [Polaribacter sp. MSW5]MDD7913387.1 adenylyltransferase/cytidyltransferase family protein [Polaribacter sp. MSW5]
MSKKYKIGYTSGVFDLFHVGHLNLLKKAKEQCDYLIVSVSTDELVLNYKNKQPVVPFSERASIVEAIKYVDKVVPQQSREKMKAYEEFQFDVMFVGDDWKGDPLWVKLQYDLEKRGSTVVYFSYTKEISSTLLKGVLNKIYSDKK